MTDHSTEEKLRKLASVDPRNAERNWLFYLGAEGKERDTADELLDVVLFQKIAKDYREKIFLEPPPAADCEGQYILGSVVYPPDKHYCHFGLREEEWIRHILIVGMTGSGKTTLTFEILRELKRKRKHWLVFDWKKNYRDLLQLPEFGDVQVLTVARNAVPFHFNPLLPPPGTAAGEWLMKLIDVIAHAYFEGLGVESLLRDAIDEVYEDCGFIDGTRHQTPTFARVREKILTTRSRGRKGLWKDSAMRALDSLCFRHGLGPVVNTTAQWDHELLLNTDVVLELDALPNADKTFLVEAIILWLYEFRKNHGKREMFMHCLVIEEAHHILSQHKESREGAETIMETSLRQIREFGEAVIAIDQEPIKISNSIKANTYCKIAFTLGNGKDKREMANCMSLNKEESECLDWLEVGHAIISLSGRIHSPLHVHFSKTELTKGLIKDSDLAERAQKRKPSHL